MISNLAEAHTSFISSDFRNTRWGMSRSDVKLAESRYPLSENQTHITYNDHFMNLDAIVGFHFINDSLIEAGYAFHEVFPDPHSYIFIYNKIKLQLSSCYGPPIIDKEIGRSCGNDTCSTKPCSSIDSRSLITEWKTLRSVIRLLLVSDKVSTEFGILHISRKHETNLNISIN